jgi:2-oxoglutarate ferredoxin oxidoreductase subunit beta
MLKAAIAHKGTVLLDVISPCVTFNDHEGSTKSYKFMQENDEPINEIGFVASFDEIEVDYDSGEIYEVEMHDGSNLRLRKLLEDYDPTDKANAVRTLMESEANDEILTGVFYINTEKPTFIDLLNVVDEPLGTLPESLTRPPKSALDSLMAAFAKRVGNHESHPAHRERQNSPQRAAGGGTIFTPMAFSLVRACAASGVCGWRWINRRSS